MEKTPRYLTDGILILSVLTLTGAVLPIPEVLRPEGLESVNGSNADMECFSRHCLFDDYSPEVDASLPNWASDLVTLRKMNASNDIIYNYVLLTFVFETRVQPTGIEVDLFLCPEWMIDVPYITVYGSEHLNFTSDLYSRTSSDFFANYHPSDTLKSCGCVSNMSIPFQGGEPAYAIWHVVVTFEETKETEWVHVGEVRFMDTPMGRKDPTLNCIDPQRYPDRPSPITPTSLSSTSKQLPTIPPSNTGAFTSTASTAPTTATPVGSSSDSGPVPTPPVGSSSDSGPVPTPPVGSSSDSGPVPTPRVGSSSDSGPVPTPPVGSSSDSGPVPTPPVGSSSDSGPVPTPPVGSSSDSGPVPTPPVGSSSDSGPVPTPPVGSSSDSGPVPTPPVGSSSDSGPVPTPPVGSSSDSGPVPTPPVGSSSDSGPVPTPPVGSSSDSGPVPTPPVGSSSDSGPVPTPPVGSSSDSGPVPTPPVGSSSDSGPVPTPPVGSSSDSGPVPTPPVGSSSDSGPVPTPPVGSSSDSGPVPTPPVGSSSDSGPVPTPPVGSSSDSGPVPTPPVGSSSDSSPIPTPPVSPTPLLSPSSDRDPIPTRSSSVIPTTMSQSSSPSPTTTIITPSQNMVSTQTILPSIDPVHTTLVSSTLTSEPIPKSVTTSLTLHGPNLPESSTPSTATKLPLRSTPIDTMLAPTNTKIPAPKSKPTKSSSMPPTSILGTTSITRNSVTPSSPTSSVTGSTPTSTVSNSLALNSTTTLVSSIPNTTPLPTMPVGPVPNASLSSLMDRATSATSSTGSLTQTTSVLLKSTQTYTNPVISSTPPPQNSTEVTPSRTTTPVTEPTMKVEVIFPGEVTDPTFEVPDPVVNGPQTGNLKEQNGKDGPPLLIVIVIVALFLLCLFVFIAIIFIGIGFRRREYVSMHDAQISGGENQLTVYNPLYVCASVLTEGIYNDMINQSDFAQGGEWEKGVMGAPQLLTPVFTDPTVLPQKSQPPIEITTDNLSEVKELGLGRFGEVVLANTKGLCLKEGELIKMEEDEQETPVLVAVKKVAPDLSETEKEAFDMEVKFLSYLKHPNILHILGVGYQASAFIVMEYTEEGDLSQFLQKYKEIVAHPSNETQISISTLLHMSSQIAKAMGYLNTAAFDYIHRDLAARNCLVGKDFTVKVADLGVNENMYHSHYYCICDNRLMPIRWMATECFDGKFSEKSDVWAFGVTIWELFTLAKDVPYPHLSDEEVIHNALTKEDCQFPPRPEVCTQSVYEIMKQCWIINLQQRATFREVNAMLQTCT